jgi:alpha-1,6-mannosyltransferase
MFYRALMKYAAENGREMRLVVPGPESGVEQVAETVLIHFVAARNSRIADPRYRVMWAIGKTGVAIRDILRRETPDVVEISDKYSLPMLAGALRVCGVQGVPRPVTIGTSHERMDDNIRAYFHWGPIGMWVTQLFLKRYYWMMFDHHVANSAYTAEELLRIAGRRRIPRSIHILPMGVDCEGLDPSLRSPELRCELAARAGIPGDARILIYCGRLAAEKNLPLLADMMKHLSPEYYLVVAGEGELKGWLAGAGPRIRTIGHLPDRAAVARALNGADVFVHPNPREPFGIAPLEAMASGLPLVVPRSGGVLSYANDTNAWLPMPNGEDFARSVQSVFADPEGRAKRVVAARKTALKHDWPKVASKYFRMYDQIAGCTTTRFHGNPLHRAAYP